MTRTGPALRRLVVMAVSVAVLFGSALPPAPAAGVTVPLVRLPFPQDDGSLTPYTFELGYPLVTLLYDTLLWRDQHDVPEPWLARSVDTSADRRTVTISLVDGVRWQDGEPLTASDVAFTFRYVAAHFHPRFTPEVAPVESAVATDATTVVVHLRQPSAGFADQPLADLPILPAHIWANLPPGQTAPPGLPMGSGPYRLVGHDATGYRFEANAGYFLGPPAVQAIQVPITDDRDAMLRAFQSGSLDAIPVDLLAGEASQVRGLGTELVDGASFAGTVLMFNVRRPPFDQLATRRAVAEALDLRAVAAAAGGVVPADHGYLDPRSPWASPAVLHRYDPADAHQQLPAPTPEPVSILVADHQPAEAAAARFIAQAMSGLGIRASIDAMPERELAAAVGEDGSPPAFQVALWSVPALASDDPSILGRLFGPASGPSSLNYTGYTSPAFDELAGRIATTTDHVSRGQAVQAALRQLATDLPVVPLFFPAGTQAFHPSVYSGWVYVQGSGILDKLSFLGQAAPPPAVGAAVPIGRAEHGGRSPLTLVTLAVLGCAGLLLLVLAGLHVADRRRRS
ncbi:MAG TPA: ABC transporter substrate-binding protein [Acidimicrobiales bacterium]|nr:ABC transporter substrate-binding protein [Acidimicrobiales bacterium]